jgi:hypothetical protein
VATGFQVIALHALAAGLCLILAQVSPLALNAEHLSLDVILYDDVGVSPAIVAGGRQTVARIFSRLDVQIAWFDRSNVYCRQDRLDAGARRAFLTATYTIRLAAGTSTWRPDTPSAHALGFAVPGTRVATVLYPRVEQVGSQTGVDIAVVLGHVVAHELGHLLLRQTTHSVAGLMQARLDALTAQQGRLLFADDQARVIRAALAADKQRRPSIGVESTPAPATGSCG